MKLKHPNPSTPPRGAVNSDNGTARQKNNSLSLASLIHRRLCHLGGQNMNKMIQGDIAIGIPQNLKCDASVSLGCEGCIKGCMHRLPFPTHNEEESVKFDFGEFTHSDVIGPYRIGTIGKGYRWIVTFTYHASDFYRFPFTPQVRSFREILGMQSIRRTTNRKEDETHQVCSRWRVSDRKTQVTHRKRRDSIPNYPRAYTRAEQ
jgi:hypothetical protein